MPSSPDAAAQRPAVSSWQPDELRTAPGLRAVAEPARPVEPGAGLALFEVAGSATVPADLLAEARAAAQAAGYSAGWAQGLQAAAARAAAEAERQHAEDERRRAAERVELERALAAVDTAAAGLEQRSLPTFDQIQSMLLESAYAIAEALVGHALRSDAERAPAALARALALAPVGEPVTVRLNPDDHALLTSAMIGQETSPGRRSVHDHRADGRDITLVADPNLEPGDAVALAGATEIDARIAAGLARVRKVLAP